MRIYSLLYLAFLLVYNGFAQTGIIQGHIINDKNNEPLEFATVQVQGTSLGAKRNVYHHGRTAWFPQNHRQYGRLRD